MELNIVTHNVRGLRDDLKCQAVFMYLKKKRYDIIFLQETHSDNKSARWWSTQWEKKIWFSHGKKDFQQVCTEMSKFNPDYHIVGGDMNFTMDDRLDRVGASANNTKSVEIFSR